MPDFIQAFFAMTNNQQQSLWWFTKICYTGIIAKEALEARAGQ